MKILGFGELGEFQCYRIDELEAARRAKAQGDRVMLGRPCTECGDLVFSESLDPAPQAQCEEGFHGNRRGVWI